VLLHDSYPPSQSHEDGWSSDEFSTRQRASRPLANRLQLPPAPPPCPCTHTYAFRHNVMVEVENKASDRASDRGSSDKQGEGLSMALSCDCASEYGEWNGDGWRSVHKLACSSNPEVQHLWIGVLDADFGLAFLVPTPLPRQKLPREFLLTSPDCGNPEIRRTDLKLIEVDVFMELHSQLPSFNLSSA
jgi:hypothetical protein